MSAFGWEREGARAAPRPSSKQESQQRCGEARKDRASCFTTTRHLSSLASCQACRCSARPSAGSRAELREERPWSGRGATPAFVAGSGSHLGCNTGPTASPGHCNSSASATREAGARPPSESSAAAAQAGGAAGRPQGASGARASTCSTAMSRL